MIGVPWHANGRNNYMIRDLMTPWHKVSFQQFLNERFPKLLADCLSLVGSQTFSTGRYTYRIKLTLASTFGDVTVEYDNLPQPDDEGVFQIDGERFVIVPYTSSDDIANATCFCAGEQLLHYFQQRLNYQAPPELPWTEELLRAWLPLNTWMREFFSPGTEDNDWPALVQILDQTNWLSMHDHLRRLYVKDRTRLFTPGHFGRTCPFETPEGPNIARILHIAVGAEIRGGRLMVVDEQPASTLGLAASMIPLLEHDHPRGLLSGANMMRQWLTPPLPEPALVQSGNEPVVPEFWCGRNLLTAFVSWGVDTFDEGILLSESCAHRFNYPQPLEPGDKLSNRHGTRGVVSRILPDEEMPHLLDGTPVELAFNFINEHSRQYFGEIREALLGRIAHLEGQTVLAPAFQAPNEVQIRARLAQLGLPNDGMETLTHGRKTLAQPSLIGWVYWGRLVYTASDKLITSARHRPQRLGELEYYALRDAGVFGLLHEFLNADTDEDAGMQAQHSPVDARKAASPLFADLSQRLAALGIAVELEGNRLTFHLGLPTGETLLLARPVPHPWLPDYQLPQIGAYPVCRALAAYTELEEANARLVRILASQAPESLVQRAYSRLITCVQTFCDALLTPAHLWFDVRVRPSGRTVVTPGAGLHYNQVGLPEAMAWDLFRPLLVQELGEEKVLESNPHAIQALDALMARSWVLVHQAPSVGPRSFIACHPVRNSHHAIRLHPFTSRLLQADFDGDQVAVYLPLTPRAQQEAGERLSLPGQLAANPDLLKVLLPAAEALWGLAYLSLSETGCAELSSLLGAELRVTDTPLTYDKLITALQTTLQQRGVVQTLTTLERLWERGFAVTQASGASISPFIGATSPPIPQDDTSKSWQLYLEELGEQFAPRTDYLQPDLGPQLLAIKSGTQGDLQHLVGLITAQSSVKDVWEQPVVIRHGYRDGLTPQELYALAVGARESFALVHRELEQLANDILAYHSTNSFHVLARAFRASQPGIIFAHAASINEYDPLTDTDSRLFVGLSVDQH
jgi:hypothetical protein